ncbi:MAG: DUF1700 domain-containing protein [Eubacteriales bacterium]|nr:DUF1700 domain-containing protein [Eubacteriales bacterium]
MTKQEFLQELKQCLSGEVSPESLMDSYRYYDNYIDDCVRGGKSEEAVVEELGKPNLIARSIIAAQSGERAADIEYTEDGKTKKVKRRENTQKQSGQWEEKEQKIKKEKKPFVFNPFAWYAKVLYVLIFILAIVLVFFLLQGLIWVVVTFAVPILLILGIIYLVMYFSNRPK